MFYIDTHILLHASLIFIRINAIIFALPFFGENVVPLHVRVLLSVALSIGLYQIIPHSWVSGYSELGALLIFGLVVREIILGLIIGYTAKIMFEGIVMAASLVGYQMGFGTANLLLPGADMQMNPFTAFHRFLILLIFLFLGFHHVYLQAIVQSFEYIPAGKSVLSDELGRSLITLTSRIFEIALQFSAPILVSLLFAMAALGLIARTVPQMNVFTMSFPASFFIGLTIYIATTPYFPEWLRIQYIAGAEQIFSSIRMLRP